MIDELTKPGKSPKPSLAYWIKFYYHRLQHQPFESRPAQIRIGTHHKTGTNWLRKIFEDIAFDYGLTFGARWNQNANQKADIFFDHHSSMVPPEGNLKGVHLIRDPRDIIVSGYHYHLWTHESWAHVPLEVLGGMTYQQKLKSLPKSEGLMLEIDRCKKLFARMEAWDYSDERFLNIKYEPLIKNEEREFTRIFQFLGFRTRIIDKLMKIVNKHSFQNATKRKVGESKEGEHLRSGKPGEWRQELSRDHLNYFHELYPDLLNKLEY